MNKKTTLFCLLLLCIATAALSCSPAGTASPSDTTLQPPTEQPQTTSLPRYINRDLVLSSLPVMGETVELTYTVNVEALWSDEWEGRVIEDLAQSHAWVEFTFADVNGSYSAAKYAVQVPLSEVAADALVWEGDALENRNIVLSGNFQIPKEGIWTITGYFSTANWTNPLYDRVKVAVADGTAAYVHTGEINTSPLAYLGFFPYGTRFYQTLAEGSGAVIVELDMTRPPMVGQEVVVSCRIISLHDIPDFHTKITFYRFGSKTRPITDFLISGDLEWQGSLEAQTPVEFSATVKFPETGEWEIIALGNTPEMESSHIAGYCDVISFSITQKNSYYGWEEKLKPPFTTITISGTTTITPSSAR